MSKYATVRLNKSRSSLAVLQNHFDSEEDENLKLRNKYELLLKDGQSNPKEVGLFLSKLRQLILMEGLPPETEEEIQNAGKATSLRGRVWQVLLHVPRVDANAYINLVRKGPCRSIVQEGQMFYDKLMRDVPRTYGGRDEPEMKRRASEDKIIRVLNAFGHAVAQENLTYAQGMNQLICPFLYVMPEVEAYFTFMHFIRRHCPTYFTKHPDIVGAYQGVELFSKILKFVDPELVKHFEKINIPPKAFTLRCILSINSITPTMPELLKLWDFLLAFGMHLNVIVVVAQIILIRDDIMAGSRPIFELIGERGWPQLDADLLLNMSIQLIRQLPENLYEELAQHPFKAPKMKKFGTLPKNFRQSKYAL